MTYQQFVGDAAFRRHYWARNHVGQQRMRQTLPNAGHLSLSNLESAGVVSCVITQNVDTLHEKAGSKNVIDLHGRFDRVVCLNCRRVITRQRLAARLDALNPGFAEAVGDAETAPDADAVIAETEGFIVADCDVCGGMLKPDIVYFGENVPRERVDSALREVDAADALLVAGSSLTVLSGYRFVRHAAKRGAPIVIVNRGPTRGDGVATVKVEGGCSPVLTQFASELPR